MLILTRKEGQVITIGEDIEVQIVNVKNGMVRIGIDAPNDISVCREEIYEKKDMPKESVENKKE